MYKRADNYRWRNIAPLLSFKLAQAIGRRSNQSSNLNAPIMIFGCARSGTTTLKEVLSGHKSIVPVPFESNNLWHPEAYPWRSTQINVAPIWVDPYAFTSTSMRARSEKQKADLTSIYGTYNSLHKGKRLLLKSAMVAFMIPEMLEMIPDLKLVHLHRDGRAVALSLAKKQWVEAKKHEALYRAKGYWLDYDNLLERMAQHWVEHIEEIERQDQALSLTAQGQLLTVNYEKFCEDTASVSHKVAAFCNVDVQGFDDSRFSEVVAKNYKFAQELSDTQMDAVMKIMEPTLKKLGYTK